MDSSKVNRYREVSQARFIAKCDLSSLECTTPHKKEELCKRRSVIDKCAKLFVLLLNSAEKTFAINQSTDEYGQDCMSVPNTDIDTNCNLLTNVNAALGSIGLHISKFDLKNEVYLYADMPVNMPEDRITEEAWEIVCPEGYLFVIVKIDDAQWRRVFNPTPRINITKDTPSEKFAVAVRYKYFTPGGSHIISNAMPEVGSGSMLLSQKHRQDSIDLLSYRLAELNEYKSIQRVVVHWCEMEKKSMVAPRLDEDRRVKFWNDVVQIEQLRNGFHIRPNAKLASSDWHARRSRNILRMSPDKKNKRELVFGREGC
jgi:hypothetical protein